MIPTASGEQHLPGVPFNWIFLTLKVITILATLSQRYCEGDCWTTTLKHLSHFCIS